MKNSKRELLMSALLANPTVKEAAASIGMPESTVYFWLKKEELNHEYGHRKRQMVTDATDHLQIKLNEAVQTVLDIMGNEEEPH